MNLRSLHRITLVVVAVTVMAYSAAFGQAHGNQPPVVGPISFSQNPINPDGVVALGCPAYDPEGAEIAVYQWKATGGSYPGGGTVETIFGPTGASINWTAPSTLGPQTITCKACEATALGGFVCGQDTLVIDVEQGNQAPIIDSLTSSNNMLAFGETVVIQASASDADGDTLTYSWTNARDGVMAVISPDKVEWMAPRVAGTYTLNLTVSDGNGGTSSASINLFVAVGEHILTIDTGVGGPARLATSILNGDIAVSKPAKGLVLVYDSDGNLLHSINSGGSPLGVSFAYRGMGQELYIADGKSGSVNITRMDGTVSGQLGTGDGEFGLPNDIYADGVSGEVFVADSKADAVKVYNNNGAYLRSITGVTKPVGLWVWDNKVYVSDYAGSSVKVFERVTGLFLNEYGGFGGHDDQFTRVQGLALDSAGNMYVADVYQSRIKAMTNAGEYIAYIGSFGNEPGKLNLPKDVSIDTQGRLIVTSAGTGRIEIFRLLVGLPPSGCPGDYDCDGMPDVFEQANGLNPFNAADAAEDADNDGLTNLQEYLAKTGVNNPDSDGDGLQDGVEVALGSSPLTPDTDGDGLTDGVEYKLGTDLSSADTDNDGLTDDQEIALGTDPLLADSDGDGIPDGDELALGLDPTVDDKVADYDGDKNVNLHEIYNLTDKLVWEPMCGPSLYCLGDINGDGATTLAEIVALRQMSLITNLVYPSTGETLDVDGNTVVDALDASIVNSWAHLQSNPLADDQVPVGVSILSPADGVNVKVGDSITVYADVRGAGGMLRPGVGIVFSIVSGNATILGGDGDADGSRWDTTGSVSDFAMAQVLVVPGDVGPIVVQALVEANGNKQLYGTLLDEITIVGVAP